MIDIGVLAQATASLLTLAMPYLILTGEKITNGAISQIGRDITDGTIGIFGGGSLTTAKEVWGKLRHKPFKKEELQSKARTVATSPDDPAAQRELKELLTKMFYDDEALALEIGDLLDKVDLNDLFTYLRERPMDLRRSFDNLIADKAKGFVGRGFIVKELDEFIKANPESGGYFIIQGDPGIGKSAIVAHLVKTRGYVHHFNIALQAINKPSQFLNSVCKQIINCYNLSDIAWPDKADQDGAFLNRVLAEASKKLKNGEELVIAIDALDEVDMVGLPARTNLLFLPESLPRGVFVVATTRREQDLAIQAMNLRIFPLISDSIVNLEDVRQYIQARFQDTQLQQRLAEWEVSEAAFEETLVNKSEGNFMYLRYVLPAIEGGYFKDGGLNQLPDGLRAYYQSHWKHMNDVEADFDELYKPVVCVLAAVKEPVSVAKIAAYTDRKLDQVSKVVKDWLEFLHEEISADDEHLFGVYHSTFKSFLSDEVDPGLKTYHAMIARYYERLMET